MSVGSPTAGTWSSSPWRPDNEFETDTVAVFETAGARGATVVVPPARTANVSGHGPRSPARDRTIQLVKTIGRRRWKQASGYHRQGRVENTFFHYRSIIGDGLRARSPGPVSKRTVARVAHRRVVRSGWRACCTYW